MKIGSLFSGYGGLDLAVEAATGARPAWFCEWDEAPSKILAHHWPDVPNYRDVTKVDWSQVEPVDIITGGSPCQDLSAAGKRAGMTEGTRSNLWVNMREAIAVIRPRLVVWENVQGALSAKATSDSDLEHSNGQVGDGGGGHLRALGRVLGDFTEIGYDAAWATLRASDVGAPHHRARVFLIAWPRVLNAGHDAGCPGLGQQHEVASPWLGEPSKGTTYPQGVGRGHGQAPDDGAPYREVDAPRDDSEPTAYPGREHGRTRGGNLDQQDTSIGPPQTDQTKRHPKSLAEDRWGEYAPAVRRWEQVVGPAPDPTEPNSKGNPRLAAQFAEWMMGLPPGWVTSPEIGLTRAQQLKAIGNGVCPQQAEVAIRHLLKPTD